jgi:hypothetical protein
MGEEGRRETQQQERSRRETRKTSEGVGTSCEETEDAHTSST